MVQSLSENVCDCWSDFTSYASNFNPIKAFKSLYVSAFTLLICSLSVFSFANTSGNTSGIRFRYSSLLVCFFSALFANSSFICWSDSLDKSILFQFLYFVNNRVSVMFYHLPAFIFFIEKAGNPVLTYLYFGWLPFKVVNDRQSFIHLFRGFGFMLQHQLNCCAAFGLVQKLGY